MSKFMNTLNGYRYAREQGVSPRRAVRYARWNVWLEHATARSLSFDIRFNRWMRIRQPAPPSRHYVQNHLLRQRTCQHAFSCARSNSTTTRLSLRFALWYVKHQRRGETLQGAYERWIRIGRPKVRR